jgi:hypothetical protein
MAHYVELGFEVIGALGTLATALSHLPFPAPVAAFFARFGATSSKFAVTQKVPS